MPQIKLQEVTVFNDINERLLLVTDEQIAACERRLNKGMAKRGEEVIGVVESVTTRALFTLWRNIDAEKEFEKSRAMSAVDEIAEKGHNEKAVFLDMLSDVLDELFWAQAKIDAGFFELENLAMRGEWKIVRMRKQGPASLMAHLLGPIEL